MFLLRNFHGMFIMHCHARVNHSFNELIIYVHLSKFYHPLMDGSFKYLICICKILSTMHLVQIHILLETILEISTLGTIKNLLHETFPELLLFKDDSFHDDL